MWSACDRGLLQNVRNVRQKNLKKNGQKLRKMYDLIILLSLNKT